MGGGSGSPGYTNEIQQGLSQANLPKSALGQQYNAYAQNVAPSIFQALINAQNLGNSAFGGQMGGQRNASLSQGPWQNLYPNFNAQPDLTNSGQNHFDDPGNHLSVDPVVGTQNEPGGSNPVIGPTGGGGGLVRSPVNAQSLLFNDPNLRGLGEFGNPFSNGSRGFHERNGDTPWSNTDNGPQNFGTGDQAGGGFNPLIDPNQQGGWEQIGNFGQGNGGIPISGQGMPGAATSNGLTAPQLSLAQIFSSQRNDQQNPFGMQMLQQGIQNPGLNFNDPFAALMQRLQGGGIPQVQNQQANVNGAQLQNANAQNVVAQNVSTPNVNLGGFNPAQANLQGLQGAINPQDSEYYNSVAQLLQQKQARDIADTRERFSGTGLSRGTPALQAESIMRGEQLPQLAQALGQVRQQETANEIARRGQVQSGILSQADLMNQAVLGGRGQDLSALLGNASNQLQAGGLNQAAGLQAGLANAQNNLQATNLNNLFNLQQRGQDVNMALSNASNNLGAQQSNQGAFLQNLSQLLQGAQGQGQLNLGQNQLQSQSGLQAQDLATQRGNALLGNQNSFLQNLQNFTLGNQAQQNQGSQFNAQQGNTFNLGLAGMQQQAVESQIQRAFSGLQNLLGVGSGLALAGQPGGSANINLGAQASGGSGWGGTLGGLGSILSALGGF